MKNNLAATTLLSIVFVGCAEFIEDPVVSLPDGEDSTAIGFTLRVDDVVQQLIGIGQTRSDGADGNQLVFECPPQNRRLKTDGNAESPDIFVNRVELPCIGNQPRAVSPGVVSAPATTRAQASDIVSVASKNFPDSVTLFGFAWNFPDTYAGGTPTEADFYEAYQTQRSLFNEGGSLLKRVRDWRSSVHWPYDRQFMRFCSVAPSIEQVDMDIVREPHFGEVSTGEYGSLPPIFHYKVPDDINRQRDLLYGKSAIINVQAGPSNTEGIHTDADNERDKHIGLDDKSVILTYNHILTAVRFARGTLHEGFRITNIRLENIVNEGQYHSNPDNTSLAYWETETAKNGHYELSTDYTSGQYGTPASGSGNYYIDNGQVLFLMPHTCSSEAKLIVTIQVAKLDASGNPEKDGSGNYIYEAGSTHTASVALTGDEWKPGYLVTYILSLKTLGTGYSFSIRSNTTPMEHNSDETGSTGTFQIDSYAQRTDYSTKEPTTGSSGSIGYTLTGYSTDGSASADLSLKPNWLTMGTPTISGNTYTVSYHFTPQQYDTSKPNGNHLSMLQTNSMKANVDLSKKDPNGNDYVTGGTRRWTANSYIVNRPGSYRIPAVYGNAYDGTSTATNFSSNTTYKDHKGNDIKRAWIANQLTSGSTTPAAEGNAATSTGYNYSADIVWQEAPALLTNVSAESLADGLYITFSVDENNIRPANAVVALTGFPTTTTTTWESTSDGGTAALVGVRQNVVTSTSGNTRTTTWDEVYYDGSEYKTKHMNSEVVTGTTAETLWTWHIWVTDEVYPNQSESSKIQSITNKDATPVTTPVMPVNLGWVPSNMRWGSYSVRDIYATFRQNGGNATPLVVHFYQHARPDLPTGHAVTYVWGSMMPLPAAGVTVYDGSGSEITDHSTITRFTPGGSTWSTSEKTLTDPCPPGFRMPAGSVFSGLSLTGNAPTAGGSNLNMWPDALNSSGITVKNGDASTGGWFYTAAHSSSNLTDADRYAGYTYVPNPGMFYMPAGTYWTGQNGFSFYVNPGYTETGTVVDWQQSSSSGSEWGIRPQGNYPH